MKIARCPICRAENHIYKTEEDRSKFLLSCRECRAEWLDESESRQMSEERLKKVCG